ncbi:MAG: HEPN domain-containing protein [Chloroflexi bacterium]|nr:HEPN domain-containing protein [Chloroflexota bacterium]
MSDPEIVVDALRWLRYAKEDLDLAAAIAHAGDRTPRHACFLAQQAAEKGLKAVLVLERVEFPFIHDLRELRRLVPDGWPVSAGLADLAQLTVWGAESRYPGDWPEPTAEDALRAEAEARRVYDSIAAEFSRRGVVSE